MKKILNLRTAIGHVVFVHRKRLDLRPAELAQKIGSSESYIAKVETGKINPTFSSFLLLADAFEIDPLELLSDITQRLMLLDNRK